MKLVIVSLLTIHAFNGIKAQQPVIGYQTIVGGLTNPVDVVNSGDSKLYIAQQNGLILTWNGSSLSNFLNIGSLLTSPSGSEQGLLSIAFHPLYTSNGYFFIWYTSSSGAVTLSRYRRDAVNPEIADPASGQVLLSIAKPGSPYFTNHNGAKLNFGTDGMLYIGTGDGGSGGDPFNNAQSGTSLLGKMLRIDVNDFASSPPFYNIPPDNPFAADGDGILNEIYSFGLRNPWRWSFDRLNNDLWIADVGQNIYEEVNYRVAGSTAGVNYGWRCREGMHVYNSTGCTTGYTDPIFEYPHLMATGGFSVTGGYVYRGSEFSSLYGFYVMADYVSGNLWLLKPQGAGASSILQSGLNANIAGFGEGIDGTLYAVRRGNGSGALYKVVVTSVIPVSLVNFSGRSLSGIDQLEWTTSFEQDISSFGIEYSEDNQRFIAVGEKAASENSGGSRYYYQRPASNNHVCYYRLGIKASDQTTRYSPVLKIERRTSEAIKLTTNIISDHQMKLTAGRQLRAMQLYSSDGKLVYKTSLNPLHQSHILQLPIHLKGIYVARFLFDNNYQNFRLTIL